MDVILLEQCILLYYDWGDILVVYTSSLVCFFQDGRLKTITVRVISPEILIEAHNFRGENVKMNMS